MNIMEKLVPHLKSDEVDDVDEFDARQKRLERNHGPRKTRPFSNGQIRRMIERQGTTRRRKMAVNQRRMWMDNRQRVAALRGQLQVVSALPLSDGTFVEEPRADIVRLLVQRYGSVVKAAETYAAIEAEGQNA